MRWDKFGDKWDIPMDMRRSLKNSSIRIQRETRRAKRKMAKGLRDAFMSNVRDIVAGVEDVFPPMKMHFRIMRGLPPLAKGEY